MPAESHAPVGAAAPTELNRAQPVTRRRHSSASVEFFVCPGASAVAPLPQHSDRRKAPRSAKSRRIDIAASRISSC